MLQTIDYIVIFSFLALSIGLGVYFQRRASASLESFFVSDRSLPWWVVGTSMVATTFAADTPLVVSGWVASHGIKENWVWWNLGMASVVSVFLFAKLWRRAGIITDAELVELRYDGKAASILRGLKGVWFGLFINLLVIAWVMKAMTKLVGVVLGTSGTVNEVWVVLSLFALTVVYTAMAGLFGVIATDVVQFIFALGGAVLLAVLAWSAAGGLVGVQDGFAAHGLNWSETSALFPDLSGLNYDSGRFFLLVGVIGLASHQVDGGGYLAQRLFAAKDEGHALLASLWFTVAHYCLRPWPWIVVGLCGLAVIGPVEDPETLYPMMMSKLLAPGLYGLMIATFLAAFMSTIDTQLNWGASLLVNDIYHRFIDPDANDVSLVRVSRLMIIGLALLGGIVSFSIDDIGFAWKLSMAVTAGLGCVYIARWYWWRTTAWSEISAMAVAAIGTCATWWLEGSGFIDPAWVKFPFNAAAIVLFSIPTWVLVTIYGPTVNREHLLKFYRRVRPGGPGWRTLAHKEPGFDDDGPTKNTFVGIVSGVMTVYGSLIGVGAWLTGETTTSIIYLSLAVAGVMGLAYSVPKERVK